MNVFWFRRDLRIADNKALYEAAKCEKVAAIYVFDPKVMNQQDFSNLHLDFIKDSLSSLNNSFSLFNSEINLFNLPALDVFKYLVDNYNIENVYSNHFIHNWFSLESDKSVQKFLNSKGIKWRLYKNNGVINNLQSRDGWSLNWNKYMSESVIESPNLSNFQKLNKSCAITDIREYSNNKISYRKFYLGGESLAKINLDEFLNSRGKEYAKNISSPLYAGKSCSRISPYLTYGNISIRQVVNATKKRQKELRELKVRDGWLGSLSAFSSRLRWHCHFIQKLEMQPNLEFTNMVEAFDSIRSQNNYGYFEAWKSGQTGFPMVDACMRYLKFNGWINFRMRAMLVSFASYNLWLDWRITSKYLSRYFIDYEPGIHYNQFQMQSGVTGINAIRIYNPIKQQNDHDKNGDFVRKWCPELENIPKDYLEYPHLMSESLQKKTGCIIGKSYPRPLVDIKISTLKAKKEIFKIKSKRETKKQAEIAYFKHGSRKSNRFK